MKSVKCSQSFINDNTITYRPHKRKSTRPFARYTKEAYICLPKNKQLSWYSKTYDGYSVFQLPQGFSQIKPSHGNHVRTISVQRWSGRIIAGRHDTAFEYTHELAWKVMKDYAEYQGYTDIRGSRDAIRKALEMGLIDDKQWMETIEARNLTSHNYDNDVVSEIYENITNFYFPLFCRFEEKMQSLNTPSLFD